MSEMKDPSEFPKAVYCSSGIFLCSYLLIALVGYYFLGDHLENPVTNNLTETSKQ